MAKRVFKTTKKLSGGRTTYRKWSEWEEGDYIIGKYVGSREDNYEKQNWLVKVEEAEFSDRKLAKSVIGQTMGLNSSGQLDKAMEQVEEGQYVQITYNGMAEIEKGKYKGKDAHSISVDLVEAEGDEGDEEDEEDDTEESEEDDGEDL